MSRIRQIGPENLSSRGKSWKVDDDGNISDEHYHAPYFLYGKYMLDDLSPSWPTPRENILEIREMKINEPATYSVSGSSTGGRRCSNLSIPGSPRVNLSVNPPAVDLAPYLTQAIARMNPNVPLVDIPLFIFELKDVPRMLKQLGDILRGAVDAATIPNGALAYQFGWRPFFNDLWTLVNLGEAMNDQAKQIGKMAVENRASGRLNIERTKFKGPLVSLTRNTNEYTFVRQETEAKQEVWFSAILSPDFSAPYWGETQFDRIRRVLGFNASASTIWNAIPWSWLIDYFTNIGSYLEATRGVLPFELSSVTLMVSDKLKMHYVLDSKINGGPQFHPGDYEFIYKRRFPMGAPNQLKIGYKQNPLVGKASIISSLAAATILSRGR